MRTLLELNALKSNSPISVILSRTIDLRCTRLTIPNELITCEGMGSQTRVFLR
ncbi:MAG: hypothetical protein QXV08_08510 [Desulfurococcus sp.]